MTSVSRYVRIPFREQFREAMLAGDKICTARTTPMGLPGQMFVAFGARFCLELVEPIRLEVVRDEFYQLEGFDSPEAFEETWNIIHPIVGYKPNVVVYIHRFFKVPVGYPKQLKESFINAFGKEFLEDASKVIVVPTESKYIRAFGGYLCRKCGKEYREHPFDENNLDQNGSPYLNALCTGQLVKL